MKQALEEALGAKVERAVLLAGGASKEAWAVDTEDGRELLVRRAGGGVIHAGTLSLRDEFEVLHAAREAGVLAPESIAYLGEVAGREAFVMERVRGETIGRRIVQRPELEDARRALPMQMAEQLALIHAIPRERLPALADDDPIERFYGELDSVGEPHPAIELGLRWVAERLPRDREHVVTHGDFRLGNLAVDENGLVGSLDWEFAHMGDPAEDVAWPLVRAWRFGVDEQRSVELAILGRLAAEMEYELLDLIERHGPRRRGSDRSPPVPDTVSPTVSDTFSTVSTADRPVAGELAAAVREFLQAELLPTLDDPRLRFRTLVAMNALGIVERESPPPQDRDWELARRIRAGDVPEDALTLVKQQVREKLLVASPSYLDRY